MTSGCLESICLSQAPFCSSWEGWRGGLLRSLEVGSSEGLTDTSLGCLWSELASPNLSQELTDGKEGGRTEKKQDQPWSWMAQNFGRDSSSIPLSLCSFLTQRRITPEHQFRSGRDPDSKPVGSHLLCTLLSPELLIRTPTTVFQPETVNDSPSFQPPSAVLPCPLPQILSTLLVLPLEAFGCGPVV